MPRDLRLAVDIGGTFTDLVLQDRSRAWSAKVLTTPARPEEGVLAGIDRILVEADARPEEISLVIHGTTLATNALIERKGARTALVTTAGFRDSIEMAYEHRFEQYDLQMERPLPLVPRRLRLGVTERLAADGTVLLPLDEVSVRALVPVLEREAIQSVAICFLHSYVDPAHERRAGAILAKALPSLSITLSSGVCPEIREYDRASTTVANAYIQPLMSGYLARLAREIKGRGIPGPLLLIMSSGGVTTVETAVRMPIRLVESGPAGGVIFACRIAAELGIARALSIDMGGTTAKLTLIDDQEPQHSRAFEVARQYRFQKGSGLPIRIPVIDMVEIGAGGGSIARVDTLGRLTVGPDSSGADPGPVCYRRGGTAPTVTDADLVLGRIDPKAFAAGKMPLDRSRAETAIAQALGEPLGMSVATAAAGIAEIVDDTMANAARVHATESGRDTADRTLIVSGGAAPLHAARLAEKLGIGEIVVPVGAGVGSAHGFLAAPIAYEVVRTRLLNVARLDVALLNRLFDEMREEATAVVRLGAGAAPLTETRAAFMRYRGQGHEITVPLPLRAIEAGDGAVLRAAFEREYETVFGRTIPKLEVEALSWTLSLSAARDRATRAPVPAERQAPLSSLSRSAFDPDSGAEQSWSVHERGRLKAGMRLAGPAVIVEDETATIVPARWSAKISANGHILMTWLGAGK